MESESGSQPQHDLSGDPLAEARRIGEDVEARVVRAVPQLSRVPDDAVEFYDCIARAGIDSRDVPMRGVCAVPRGAVVEVKSASTSLSSGQRGRFYLRQQQHERLVDASGYYLFAVRDGVTEQLLALKLLAATTVGGHIPDWRSGGQGRDACRQLSWGNFFEATEVEDAE